MRLTPSISRLNDHLRLSLGTSPQYSWRWSEDLIRVMGVVDQGGLPVFQPVATGSLYRMKQVHVTRKLAPDLVNQWCICALIDPYSPTGKLDGSNRAIWMPVRTKTRSKACALPENLAPTQSDTDSFISQMNRTRARDEEEMAKWEWENELHAVPLNESEPNSPMVSRAQRKRFEEDALKIRDKFTAFGEEPGAKGSTSFPSRDRVN